MRRRYRAKNRPEITIAPINRNSSDDTLVVGKISVDSDFCPNTPNEPTKPSQTQKHTKKKNFFENIQLEDIIIVGIIIMLLLKRNEPDYNDDDLTEERTHGFSIEGLKKMIPIDKLSENDILLGVMLYLLF